MLYIVLGMHKSGTTMISEMLHHSGVNMVEDYDPTLTYDSALGKMERRTAVEIDHDILNSRGVDSLDIHALPDSYILPEEIKVRIKEMIATCEERHEDWGIKDPRFCLTYHLWKPFLPDHRIIVVFRNPAQVIKHYAKYYKGIKKVIRSYRALQAYTMHNDLLLQTLEKTDVPSLIINYEDVMGSENILNSLSDFIRRPVKDTRKKNLYRNTSEQDARNIILHTLDRHRANRVYDTLRNLSPYS